MGDHFGRDQGHGGRDFDRRGDVGGGGSRGAAHPRPQGDLRYNPKRGGREEGRARAAKDSRVRELEKETAKPSPPSGNLKTTKSLKCFRCTEVGHHQLDCTNDPVCYKCKQPGHMAGECGSLPSKKLKMFGFAISGQGFYAIETPEKGKVE